MTLQGDSGISGVFIARVCARVRLVVFGLIAQKCVAHIVRHRRRYTSSRVDIVIPLGAINSVTRDKEHRSKKNTFQPVDY